MTKSVSVQDEIKLIKGQTIQNSNQLRDHNAELTKLGQSLYTLDEVVEALIEVTGIEMVREQIKEIKRRKLEDRFKANLKSIEDGVANGFVGPVEEVTESSLIVGKELDKDGNDVTTHFNQFCEPYASERLSAEAKPKLLKLKKGERAVFDNGNQVEIVEVYGVDLAKYAEYNQAQAQAAKDSAVNNTNETASA